MRAAAVHPGVIETELARHVDPARLQALIDQISKERAARRVRNPSDGRRFLKAPQHRCGRRSSLRQKRSAANIARTAMSASRGGLRGDSGVSEGVRAYALDPNNAEALWKKSEEMVGEKILRIRRKNNEDICHRSNRIYRFGDRAGTNQGGTSGARTDAFRCGRPVSRLPPELKRIAGVLKTWKASAPERPSRTASSTVRSFTTSRNSKQNCEHGRTGHRSLGLRACRLGSASHCHIGDGWEWLRRVRLRPKTMWTAGSPISSRFRKKTASVAEGRQRFGDAPSAGSRHGQARACHLSRSASRVRKACRLIWAKERNRWAAAHVLGCRSSLPACAREARSRREISRGGRRGRTDAGYRRNHRPRLEGAGGFPVAGKGAAHFGWLAMFAGLDMPASSVQTQQRLGWHPTGPGLIADLEKMNYHES